MLYEFILKIHLSISAVLFLLYEFTFFEMHPCFLSNFALFLVSRYFSAMSDLLLAKNAPITMITAKTTRYQTTAILCETIAA